MSEVRGLTARSEETREAAVIRRFLVYLSDRYRAADSLAALDALVAQISALEEALTWALDVLDICYQRIDSTDDLSPEHYQIRAAGMAKARAALTTNWEGGGNREHLSSAKAAALATPQMTSANRSNRP